MKKIIFPAFLILAGTLHAEPFDVNQNPDLYDGNADSTVFPTATQPGIGDSYGSSSLYSTGFSQTRHIEQKGNVDGYASVLLDLDHKLNW